MPEAIVMPCPVAPEVVDAVCVQLPLGTVVDAVQLLAVITCSCVQFPDTMPVFIRAGVVGKNRNSIRL